MEALPVTHYIPWANMTGSPLALLRSAAEAGIKHIVLTDDLIRLAMSNMKGFDSFCRNVEKAGLDFVDAHAPFSNICDLSLPLEQYRPVMIAQNKFVLNLCAAAGVKNCTIHLGNCRYEQKFPLEYYWKCSERSLEELLPEAEKCDVVRDIENIWNPPSLAKQILCYRKKFDTPYLGVCFDSGHAEIARSCHKDNPVSEVYESWKWLPEEEPRWDDDVPEEMIPLAVSCHIHDNNGLKDQHKLPFTGVVQWERIIPLLARALREQKVELRGDAEVCKIVSDCIPATQEDWDTEYLAPILSIRIVHGIEEAVAHIAEHGSGHTDGIITNSLTLANQFIAAVDSASVLVNASTRLSGGGDYGMGAVVGISTDRLHARGPVGPNELCTGKWVAVGNGQLRK